MWLLMLIDALRMNVAIPEADVAFTLNGSLMLCDSARCKAFLMSALCRSISNVFWRGALYLIVIWFYVHQSSISFTLHPRLFIDGGCLHAPEDVDPCN